MCDWALMTALIFLSFGLKHLNLKVHCTACQHKNSNMLPTKNHKHLYTGVIKIGGNRGKVKTKHDITWFAQKTNVDQLNSAYVYDSGGVKIFLLFTL
jgi:hypothetical protein